MPQQSFHLGEVEPKLVDNWEFDHRHVFAECFLAFVPGNSPRPRVNEVWARGKNDRCVITRMHMCIYILWVFPKIVGNPQNGRFKRDNPIKMDDLGVPLFLETPIYMYNMYV